ncbi:MAG: alpha/beta hydrolase family protein [Sphingorhabdus sp.]
MASAPSPSIFLQAARASIESKASEIVRIKHPHNRFYQMLWQKHGISSNKFHFVGLRVRSRLGRICNRPMGQSMYLRILAAFLFCISGVALAQSDQAAQAFGKREGIEDISLSPDGTKIAYIQPAPGQGNRLFIVDLIANKTPIPVLSAAGDPERLNGCEWVSNARLVCLIYAVSQVAGERFAATRVIAINSDGTELKMLSKRQGINAERFSFFGGSLIDLLPGDDGAVLMGREYVPESAIGTIIAKDEDGYGVDRIDTLKLSNKRVVKPSRLAVDYISDGNGNVRIMSTMIQDGAYDSGKRRFHYRSPAGGDWTYFGEYDYRADSGFLPVAVDPDENVAYGYEKLNGRMALYKVKLEEGLSKTLVYSHDNVDIDNLITLGRRKKVVGFSYATDRRHALYFDQTLSKLGRSLSKILPNAEQVSFGGLSADGNKMIVGTWSDTNPGIYYHFDKISNQVSPLFAVRPELERYKLAEVKSVTVKAADGTAIPAYLTLPAGGSTKGLPAIVMPHGGPSSRDEWGFDWLAQFYANRGFAVLQPNYRGSSGYGDDWYQNNGFQSWKIAVGDVNDSGRWLISQGIADPDKLAIVGWSYGGYAALQSAVLDPKLFKAIIAIAPVTDLGKLKDESLGYSNHRVIRDFIGSGPHISEGSPARNAGYFEAPVALFHGDFDLNVSVFQSRFMADQLKSARKSVELTVYPKIDHGLYDNAVRADMLSKSDAFLRKSLKLPAI